MGIDKLDDLTGTHAQADGITYSGTTVIGPPPADGDGNWTIDYVLDTVAAEVGAPSGGKPPSVVHLLRWFPDAMGEVARVFEKGGEKYHGGEVKWLREKSKDDLGSLCRHLVPVASEGALVKDGENDTYHLAHVVWRALAALQRELS